MEKTTVFIPVSGIRNKKREDSSENTAGIATHELITSKTSSGIPLIRCFLPAGTARIKADERMKNPINRNSMVIPV
ncbi:MAG TPA: hypothetical protein P5531_01895 [Bacteroidales bacterium]|nr:hypothetical protein [Bacteroidales bacterium]